MNTKFYTLLSIALLGFGSLSAQTTTSYTFTLPQAIEYAFKNQAAVLNAQLDEQIAKNTVKQTTGIGLPQVSGSFSFQDFLKLPTSLLPGDFFGQPGTQVPVQFGVKYQSALGLEASQLLFDGSYLVGLQAAKTYKELSIRNSKRTKIETAVAVSKAYYSVLVSNEQLGLLDANLVRLKKSLHDIEAYYKNGLVEKVDVDRLHVLTNNLETERENVIRLLALNTNLLKFQMGMPIETNLTLNDSIKELSLTADVLVADSLAYKNRVEFSLGQTQKKLNELNLKRYKSEFLPSIVAFGSTSNSYQNNSFSQLYTNYYPTSLVGLKLSLPLISGGQRIYKIKNARLEVQKSANDLANLQNGINLEIIQAKTSFLNGLQSLENQKRNMELSKEVLRISKVKYEQGVGSSLEVTAAETSLKESQNNYINALYESLINKVNLDRALGRINY
ncbi:MAG: TolC family protein [Sphingobacteriaceae bacterium]|nr:TolC family protein [Sphingobacteriaceae bacterium]